MAGLRREDLEQNFKRAAYVRSRTRATYDTLMRQSEKLGQAATQVVSDAGAGAKQIFRRQNQGKEDDDITELKKVVAHSHEVIASARTFWPFFFPHEIILDRTKVIIIKRIFFWSSDVISIRIEDVLNVSGSVGPLFGSVTIASRVMSTVDHFEVDRFWRDDARRMVRVIEGYLIARQNGIATDHLSCTELADVLCNIRPAEGM